MESIMDFLNGEDGKDDDVLISDELRALRLKMSAILSIIEFMKQTNFDAYRTLDIIHHIIDAKLATRPMQSKPK